LKGKRKLQCSHSYVSTATIAERHFTTSVVTNAV